MRRAPVLACAVLILALVGWAQTLQPQDKVSLPAGVSVTSAAIAPDGAHVAAACSDGVVRVWALPPGTSGVTPTDRAVRPYPLRDVNRLQFSADGLWLAAGSGDGAITIWDVASGKVLAEFHGTGSAETLAVSPDKRLVVAALHDSAVQVWDLETHKLLATVRPPFGGSSALAFSPDGVSLATADEDTQIRIYDARSGVLRTTVSDLLLETFALAFSADGKTLLAGGADETISIIDPGSGKVLGTLPKASAVVAALSLSPDGKRVAAAYYDPGDPKRPAPLLVFDLAGRALQATVQQPGLMFIAGDFARDGRLLLAGIAPGELSVWSVR